MQTVTPLVNMIGIQVKKTLLDAAIPELSMGPFYVTQSNPAGSTG